MSGLLLAGILFPVPNVTVIGPHEAKWAHLGIGDYRMRHGHPQMLMAHTTKGDYPQKILETIGPTGRAERTAEMWGDDPAYSGAHGVTGSDGVASCLADGINVCAYHATISNDRAIGWEIYQEANGVIHRIALVNTVAIFGVYAEQCLIPRQYPIKPYLNKPLDRMLVDGGRDCYGCFGHRDNTDRRGRGDPGDAFFEMLGAAGWEGFDFAAKQDLDVWAKRQEHLNKLGEKLVVDGQAGQGTMLAMRKHGFASGRALDVAAVF